MLRHIFFWRGICAITQPAERFHVVLRGSVLLTEPVVHHAEGTRSVNLSQQTRQREVECGESFHHLPLVAGMRHYGYSACASEEGALLLLLPRDDYAYILRPAVVNDMTSAVDMLKSTKFFETWSAAALRRLYFWLERVDVRFRIPTRGLSRSSHPGNHENAF